MDSNIQIIEKPDWVSWDDIQRCLMDAHSVNRAKGLNMARYQWPGEKIRDFLGDKGVMLVALDGRKIVGTAAIADKTGEVWYAKGHYAYLCFAGIHPEYGGRGIYKRLLKQREEIAIARKYNTLLFDTHCHNKRVQEIAKKNGYRLVRFYQVGSKDHYSVVMVKWLNDNHYSRWYCIYRYQKSKLKSFLMSVCKN